MKYVLSIITLTLMAFTLSLNVPAQNGPPAEFVDGVVALKFKPGSSSNKKQDAVNSVNGNTLKEYTIVPGLQKISTNLDVQKAIDILSKNPNVEYAEPDFIVNVVHADRRTPNDPLFVADYLWAMDNGNDADLDGPEAWNHDTGDPNFIVANIDTGVDIGHEDLAGNIWENLGEKGDDVEGNPKETNGVDDDGNGYVDDVNGWDFRNNDNDPYDGHGHGTHTAGTSCARGDNNTGVTGVVWDCKIMALKFLSDQGSGSTLDAVEAIQYAADFGVKVSNNSWGGGGCSISLYNAIQASQSVFVAAAGNSNSNNDVSSFYPSNYGHRNCSGDTNEALDNVIAVASITSTGAKSSFSSYGANSVDLGAGGSSIRSTLPGGYASWSGTSMATPHVTGVVALVFGNNPSESYQNIIDQIYRNVKPWGSMSGITTTGGIVDAHCALIDCDGGGTGPTPTPTATPTPTPTPPPPASYECDVYGLSNGACDHGPCTGRDRLICPGTGYQTLCQRVSDADQNNSCCYSNALDLSPGIICTYSGQPTPTSTPTPTATPTPTPTPPLCGVNRDSCTQNSDCCSLNCKNGTCRGN